MVFAPKLSEGVAFNQPVQQPNAMEAIAGLFDFGVKVATKSRENAPKPTEDEKFAVAVKEFEADKGAAFNWDRKGMREFIFKYPQFTDQAKTYAENLGVMTTSPQETARDAANEWFGTSEGMMAVAYASNLPEDEQEAYLSEQVTKAKQQEAKLAELERNNAIYAAEGTLTTKQWDIMKPTAKDMVDHTVGAVLNTIVTDVTNGLTIEVDPELKAMLGIRYDSISMNNLNAVLSDTKTHLETQFRKTYSGSFGQDMLPPDDWNKSVFASLDALMKIGDAVKDPQARAATQRALIDSALYKTLDDNGVALVVRLAETMPPESLNRLIGDMANFDEAFSKALAGDGKVFGTAGIAAAVQDGSKSDAESIANDAIKTFEYGIVPEFFTAFKEAQKRAGYNVVDGESFKKITGSNIPEIIKLTSTNPDFRGEFGDFLTSDINKTVSVIKSNLPTEVTLTLNSKGQFSLVYTGDGGTSRAEAAMGADAFAAAEIKKAQEALPEGLNLTVLNEKIATLGLMGEFGKEIQGAIGILNTEPAGKKNSAFGGGGVTPRGRSRGSNTGVAVPADDPRWGGSGVSDDPEWQKENLVTIQSGNGESWQVNKLAAAAFQGFLTELEATGYGIKSSGGFNYRPIRGSKTGKLSEHGKGLAIDLNAETNGLGSETTDLPPNVSEIAAKYGLKWGGDFKGRKDPMHFEYVVGGGGPAGMPVDSLPKEDQGTPSGTISLDSGSSDPQRASGDAPTAPTGLSTGTMLSFESPEVQQIVEKATSAPEEAIAMAKEILAKPMDPSIKALIEALVRIGERA
jgi:hypothetical protein